MTYEIKLDVFEGPLDLLLHLIHRNEVSITDIPIALITQQYLETVELMRTLNLDVAGEYLVMAAYLTHIKSRMLLPVEEDPEQPEEQADPRDELVAHLLEYKRYKDAASELGDFPLLDRDVFVKEALDDFTEPAPTDYPIEVSLHQLVDAFRDLLNRTTRRDLIELEPDTLHVKDKIRDILDILKSHEIIAFTALFDELPSRRHILTTFLALLEVVKLQLVRVYQDDPFGEILLARRGSPDAEGDENAVCSEAETDHGSSD